MNAEGNRATIKMMGLNPLTLSFSERVEKMFLKKYYQDSLFQFRVAFLSVTALYGLFGILDKPTVNDFANAFLIIRFAIVIPFLLIVFLLSFTRFFQRIWQSLLFVSFLVAGAGIAAMTAMVPDNYAYYAGMMLIFSAGYFFIKLRFFLATLAGWLTLVIFNVLALLLGGSNLITMITNNAFYIAANIIGMMAAYYIEFYARRDFFQQEQLKEERQKVLEANRNLEEKVEARTKALKKSNDELIIAKEEAEKSDKLKSAFLANMSHEIRTPMNGILGFAELIKEDDDLDDIRENADIILSNSKHLLELINDIVDISKIEAGVMEMKWDEFYLNELIGELAAFFRADTQVLAKNLEIKTACALPDEKSLIKIDRTRLRQVLVNLIKNACKYTEKGYVEIGYNMPEDNLVFYVKDTGVGLSEEQISFIFNRFMQVATTISPNEEGVGLGLTISKAIVNQFGGEIWVESEPGQGAIFYFNIPDKPGENVILQTEFQMSSNMDYDWKDKVILVAEDVPTNFLLVKKSLRKTNVQLLWAKNGKETVETVEGNENIDMVLMDIRMPIMNGLDATKEIKKLRPDLVVIAQTAYAMDGDRENSLAAGCDDYISKPINLKEFIELIAKYMK
jgi:signal transduction histidine kinase